MRLPKTIVNEVFLECSSNPDKSSHDLLPSRHDFELVHSTIPNLILKSCHVVLLRHNISSNIPKLMNQNRVMIFQIVRRFCRTTIFIQNSTKASTVAGPWFFIGTEYERWLDHNDIQNIPCEEMTIT